MSAQDLLAHAREQWNLGLRAEAHDLVSAAYDAAIEDGDQGVVQHIEDLIVSLDVAMFMQGQPPERAIFGTADNAGGE